MTTKWEGNTMVARLKALSWRGMLALSSLIVLVLAAGASDKWGP